MNSAAPRRHFLCAFLAMMIPSCLIAMACAPAFAASFEGVVHFKSKADAPRPYAGASQ